MSVPFTPEVTRSLAYLRQGISEVQAVDASLSETLTAIVDDMIVNWENQLLLMFANFGSKEEERRELLFMQRQDASVLQFYNEMKEKSASGKRGASPGGAFGLTRVPSPGFGANFRPLSPQGVGSPRELTASTETDVVKTLTSSLYVLTESIAHRCQAERCLIYLHHKGSGSLRVICSCPDPSPVAKGAFVASHSGIPGSVFSTGVGIRLDKIDSETFKNYIQPTDKQLEVHTTNLLAFPIVDRHQQCIGVIECANRLHNSRWSEVDEALMFHAAQFIEYILCNFSGIDFHAISAFNPAALHLVTPYRPAPLAEELREMPAARDARIPQLVARVTGFSGVPVAVKGKQQPAIDSAEPISTVLQVKEMQSYLRSVDVGFRHCMNELVQAKEREEAAHQEISKKLHRIRVLESNVNFLHEQLSQYVGHQGASPGASPSPAGPSATTLGQLLTGEGAATGPPAKAGRRSSLTSGISHPASLASSGQHPKLLPGVHSTSNSLVLRQASSPLPHADPKNLSKEELYKQAQETLAVLKAVALEGATAKQRGKHLSPTRGGPSPGSGKREASTLGHPPRSHSSFAGSSGAAQKPHGAGFLTLKRLQDDLRQISLTPQ